MSSNPFQEHSRRLTLSHERGDFPLSEWLVHLFFLKKMVNTYQNMENKGSTFYGEIYYLCLNGRLQDHWGTRIPGPNEPLFNLYHIWWPSAANQNSGPWQISVTLHQFNHLCNFWLVSVAQRQPTIHTGTANSYQFWAAAHKYIRTHMYRQCTQ